MNNTRIRCTNCNYGNRVYEGSTEIRAIRINAKESELKKINCPDCFEKKLVKY